MYAALSEGAGGAARAAWKHAFSACRVVTRNDFDVTLVTPPDLLQTNLVGYHSAITPLVTKMEADGGRMLFAIGLKRNDETGDLEGHKMNPPFDYSGTDVVGPTTFQDRCPTTTCTSLSQGTCTLL